MGTGLEQDCHSALRQQDKGKHTCSCPGEFNSDQLVETFDDADEGVRDSVARENFY